MEHLTHWKNQFNYDYLGAYSLSDGKDIVLTIKETKKEMVTGANGQKSECFVAYFHENVKPMILNKTNCKAIEKMYKTPNIEEWVDKQIQIGVARINAFGETTDCLRSAPLFSSSVMNAKRHLKNRSPLSKRNVSE